MEFADWVVSGLDQLRTGRLPGGQALYQTVSAGLGGHPVVDAFMNTGDPAARAHLVQLIAQTAAMNPGFEQQLRASAAAAQGGGAPKTPFLKTSNGIAVLVVAAVLVVGGGVALAVGLSGGSSDKTSSGTGGAVGGSSGGGGKIGGSGGLVSILKGTWNCTGAGGGGGGGTVTIGDGTWSAGGDSGTWTLNGGKATVTSKNNPGDDISATNVPSGAGAFDILASSSGDNATPEPPTHVKGLVSAHELNVQFSVPGSDVSPTLTCKK